MRNQESERSKNLKKAIEAAKYMEKKQEPIKKANNLNANLHGYTNSSQKIKSKYIL